MQGPTRVDFPSADDTTADQRGELGEATGQHNRGHVSAVIEQVLDLLEPMMDLDRPMDLSGFNAPFQPARSEFGWLSRDEAQVDEYIGDPLCGFGLDTAGSKATFIAARQLTDAARVAGMPNNRGEGPT